MSNHVCSFLRSTDIDANLWRGVESCPKQGMQTYAALPAGALA